MIRIHLCLVALIICSPLAAAGIREFDLRTLERLGNQLSRQDSLAAKASDLVFAKYPAFKKVSPQGWVTDSKNGSVYWIVETKSGPSGAYKVIGNRVEDIHGKPLPPDIVTRFKARQNAMKAVLPKLNAAHGAKYNFEVLNDPDGSGFLVYALAAFSKSDAIYFGGHFRITVSADGAKAERIDDLSKGIMRNAVPADAKPVALGSAQVVGTKYPVETTIYSSNLYKIPIGVGTPDGTIWMVANGRIENTGQKTGRAKKAGQKK